MIRMTNILLTIALILSAGVWAETESSVDPVDKEAVGEQATQAETGEPALTVEELLNRDPSAEDYVDTERCLSTHRIRRMDVLDEKHVAVQVSRDQYYLIQFKNRCHGLRAGKPIMQEARGASLCQHDSIRAMDQWGFGRMRPGPPCTIPGFQSISKEQLMHLKDALKAEKRKKKQKNKSKDKQA